MKNKVLVEYTIYETNPFYDNSELTENSFRILMVISGHGLKLLHYLSYRSRKNKLLFVSRKDNFEVNFDIDDAVKVTGISKSSIYVAIKELLENNIIARTRSAYIFFINPEFLCHGSNKRLCKQDI